jgi:hypothetical protein
MTLGDVKPHMESQGIPAEDATLDDEIPNYLFWIASWYTIAFFDV